jgi:hypothetical protein
MAERDRRDARHRPGERLPGAGDWALGGQRHPIDVFVLPPPRVGVGIAKGQRESFKAGGEAIEVHRTATGIRRIERTRGRIADRRSVSHRYYPPKHNHRHRTLGNEGGSKAGQRTIEGETRAEFDRPGSI